MMSEHGTVRPFADDAAEAVIPATTARPTTSKAGEKCIVTKSYTALVSYVPRVTLPKTGPWKLRRAESSKRARDTDCWLPNLGRERTDDEHLSPDGTIVPTLT